MWKWLFRRARRHDVAPARQPEPIERQLEHLREVLAFYKLNFLEEDEYGNILEKRRDGGSGRRGAGAGASPDQPH